MKYFFFFFLENGIGLYNGLDKGRSDNSCFFYSNKFQGLSQIFIVFNGKVEENFMCFECVEEFDIKVELEEYVKGYKVYIKKENISFN